MRAPTLHWPTSTNWSWPPRHCPECLSCTPPEHCTIQRSFFLVRELAHSSFRQVAELQRADSDTYQPEDFYSERREKTADLTILTFIEHNLEPTVLFSTANDGSMLNAENFAVSRFDSGSQPLQELLIGHSRDLNVISLVQVSFRRCNPRAPF